VRTGGESLVRGFLAEVMVLQYLSTWFYVKHIDDRNADIAIIHPTERELCRAERRKDITVDVKAIVTRARRRTYRGWMPVCEGDEVQLHTNYRQRCDFLIFVRVHEDLGSVWICGSILKEHFLRESRLHGAGTRREYRRDTRYHEDTRVMRVRELESCSLPRINDDFLRS